jgi:hypothetical protein
MTSSPKMEFHSGLAYIGSEHDGHPFIEVRTELKQHLPAVFGKHAFSNSIFILKL